METLWRIITAITQIAGLVIAVLNYLNNRK